MAVSPDEHMIDGPRTLALWERGTLLPWAEIKDLVTCASCSKWTSPLRRICGNSHLTCSTCSDVICPVTVDDQRCASTCTQISTDKYSIVYNENILPCPYEANGCKMKLFGRGMDNHLVYECHFKSVRKCIITGCNTKNIDAEYYGVHLRVDHDVPHVNVPKMRVLVVFAPVPMNPQDVVVRCILTLACFGVKFAIFFGEYGHRVALWAAVFDEQMIGKKYLCKITLRGTCRQDRNGSVNPLLKKRSVEFPVKSLHSQNVIEMDAGEECFSINTSLLQYNFLESNNFGQELLKVEITIKESQ